MSSDINVQTFSGKVNINNNLLVGTSHLFVDTINNRVGLVTNTPDAGLHVNSNAYVHTNFRVGSGIVMNDTTGQITAGSFVGDGSAMTGINSDSGSWVNGTNSNVHLATSTDKVGIGTTSPLRKFHVVSGVGDTSTNWISGVFGGSGDYPRVVLGSLSAYACVGSHNSALNAWADLYLNNPTNPVVVKPTGKVGIGTTSPMNTGLHIANSYFASGGNTDHFNPQIFITGNSGTSGNQVSAIGFSGNSAADTHQRMVGGAVYYKGGGGFYGLQGYLGIAVPDVSSSGSDPYGLTEGELESHTRLAINNSGNVGIGTTDPQAPFHVKPVNNTSNADNTLLDFRGDFTGSNHGFLGIFATETHTNAVGPDLRFKGAVYNNTANPTINQVMCLKPTGKVGIGITEPTEVLDIKPATSSDSAFIRVRSGSGGSNPVTESGLKLTESGEYGFQFVHSGATDLLKIRHQNSAGAVDRDDMMVWNPNGNVGIGTSSPSQKLDVVGGPTKSDGFILSTANNVYTPGCIYTDSNWGMLFRSAVSSPGIADFLFNDYAGNQMMVINDNKVGIGTTSPGYTLDVQGDINSTGKINIGSYAVAQGYMTSRTLTLGTTSSDYGGGSSWNTNTAAILLECLNNTEIAVHDSGTRVASLMHYEGSPNRITIGRDMGWGTISSVRMYGSQSYPNRPVAMVGKSNGRVYVPNVIVYNSVFYNDGGLYNTGNGRFTAPAGYAGYYLVTYTGLGGANETAPNTRWQLNGNDLAAGSAHVNNSPCSSRWGISAQLIVYLNAGDFLTHRVIGGSVYGSSPTHSTTVCMFLGSR